MLLQGSKVGLLFTKIRRRKVGPRDNVVSSNPKVKILLLYLTSVLSTEISKLRLLTQAFCQFCRLHYLMLKIMLLNFSGKKPGISISV